MKSIFSVLLALGILFSTCACSKQATGGDETTTTTTTTTTNAGLTEAIVKVGEYLSFGKYEQDNNTANGQEPIEWLVLEVKDGKALLISKYGLDFQPYDTGDTAVTWGTCSLRQWLNTEFLNAAFSAEEQKIVSAVRGDTVFLLNIIEAKRYFASDSERKCEPTVYALAKGTWEFEGACQWWLRSPGMTRRDAADVYGSGDINDLGQAVFATSEAVRPALWVTLNS